MTTELPDDSPVLSFQDRPVAELPEGELRDALLASINLMENTTRGVLAEAIVAVAVGGKVTPGWDPWDIDTAEGIRIEVKATGPIQSWPQKKPYELKWDIAPKGAWERTNGQYVWSEQKCRRADVYVFALHEGVRPADLHEWQFRVVSRVLIDRIMPAQKTVRPSSVDARLSPVIMRGTNGLREAVLAAYDPCSPRRT